MYLSSLINVSKMCTYPSRFICLYTCSNIHSDNLIQSNEVFYCFKLYYLGLYIITYRGVIGFF